MSKIGSKLSEKMQGVEGVKENLSICTYVHIYIYSYMYKIDIIFPYKLSSKQC